MAPQAICSQLRCPRTLGPQERCGGKDQILPLKQTGLVCLSPGHVTLEEPQSGITCGNEAGAFPDSSTLMTANTGLQAISSGFLPLR